MFLAIQVLATSTTQDFNELKVCQQQIINKQTEKEKQ